MNSVYPPKLTCSGSYDITSHFSDDVYKSKVIHCSEINHMSSTSNHSCLTSIVDVPRSHALLIVYNYINNHVQHSYNNMFTLTLHPNSQET